MKSKFKTTKATRDLVFGIVVEKLGTKKDKYLKEEKQFVTTAKF